MYININIYKYIYIYLPEVYKKKETLAYMIGEVGIRSPTLAMLYSVSLPDELPSSNSNCLGVYECELLSVDVLISAMMISL